MDSVVNIVAPKSILGFVVRFIVFEAVIFVFAVSVMLLVHGGFPFGLRQQFIDVSVMSTPFVTLTLLLLSHQHKLQQRLLRMATTDALTGLLNRRGFMDQVDPWLRANVGGIFVLADADRFKKINDDFGHEVGDICLKAIAAHLRKVSANGDLLARIGGEEFALCLAPTSGVDFPVDTLYLTGPIDVDAPLGRSLTLSAGGVIVRLDDTPDRLMRLADERLYFAKNAGRARIVLSDPEMLDVELSGSAGQLVTN